MKSRGYAVDANIREEAAMNARPDSLATSEAMHHGKRNIDSCLNLLVCRYAFLRLCQGVCNKARRAAGPMLWAAMPVLASAGLLGWSTARAALLDEPIQPIPLTLKQDPARSEIGRLLFRDPGLSLNGRISCISCHDLGKGGGDGRGHSLGLNGQLTDVNAPTVFNAAFNFKQFWNGRADTLEDQIDHVLQSPVEMGSKWSEILQKISANPKYKGAFSAAYKDGVTKSNVQNAIATFERTLITPNARFDKFLRGDANAISASEKSGYAKFKQYGCVACHQGVNVGGNMFQKFGIMGDFFEKRGNPTQADLGRYLVTKIESDKHVFKVPSLRNVALTAPYFHDASAKTLEEAVDVMFRYQLGRIASKEDKELIIKFLNTLTGELEVQP